MDTEGSIKQYALHLAVTFNNKEEVERLISIGVDINEKDNGESTPLDIAVYNLHREIIEILLNNGADTGTVDGLLGGPFHTLICVGDCDMIESFINKGADIHSRDFQRKTILHYAAIYNSRAVVELLIKKGVDVNAEDRDGVTPIKDAILFGRIKMFKMLLSHESVIYDIDDLNDCNESMPHANKSEISKLLETAAYNITKRSCTLQSLSYRQYYLNYRKIPDVPAYVLRELETAQKKTIQDITRMLDKELFEKALEERRRRILPDDGDYLKRQRTR
jgi:ankyrin repeat protein